MAAPTQLNIVVAVNGGGADGGTITVSTVTLPIPAGLQALDSNNSFGGGQASQQTGFSSVDQLVRSIFKAGCFFVPATQTWYSSNQIQSIGFQ